MTAEDLTNFFTGMFETGFIYKCPVEYMDVVLVETALNGSKEEPPYIRFAPFTQFISPKVPPNVYICTDTEFDHADFQLIASFPGEPA